MAFNIYNNTIVNANSIITNITGLYNSGITDLNGQTTANNSNFPLGCITVINYLGQGNIWCLVTGSGIQSSGLLVPVDFGTGNLRIWQKIL